MKTFKNFFLGFLIYDMTNIYSLKDDKSCNTAPQMFFYIDYIQFKRSGIVPLEVRYLLKREATL